MTDAGLTARGGRAAGLTCGVEMAYTENSSAEISPCKTDPGLTVATGWTGARADGNPIRIHSAAQTPTGSLRRFAFLGSGDAMSNPWGWSQLSRAGYVYLLKANDGLYKIGRARDLDRRVIQLRKERPSLGLELVAYKKVKDCLYAERQWHKRFADKRRGPAEWFALTPDDVTKFERGR